VAMVQVARRMVPGLAIWALGLGLALGLPGAVWKQAAPPPFPWEALAPTLLALGMVALLAPLLAWWHGPQLATRRGLALLEAPPDLLWAALLLAVWPAAWGPPGPGGWGAAFLATALPAEVRWLAQALPEEHPFPQAWGLRAVRRSRRIALGRLWGRWLAARLPLGLTATLGLERVLGQPGLGTDWMTRVVVRDRTGLALWVLLLAVLWALSQTWEHESP
jgi:hypothetical protein